MNLAISRQQNPLMCRLCVDVTHAYILLVTSVEYISHLKVCNVLSQCMLSNFKKGFNYNREKQKKIHFSPILLH